MEKEVMMWYMLTMSLVSTALGKCSKLYIGYKTWNFEVTWGIYFSSPFDPLYPMVPSKYTTPVLDLCNLINVQFLNIWKSLVNFSMLWLELQSRPKEERTNEKLKKQNFWKSHFCHQSMERKKFKMIIYFIVRINSSLQKCTKVHENEMLSMWYTCWKFLEPISFRYLMCYFWTPYIFHSKQRESFYFPRLPQFKLAFWDCYVWNLGLAHAKFQLTYAIIP